MPITTIDKAASTATSTTPSAFAARLTMARSSPGQPATRRPVVFGAISASRISPGIVTSTMPNPPKSARRQIGDLVRVDGHDVHVRHDGPEDAPAVVLVHGFACSMHWFDRVTAELAADHRVIRVDLLGHGCTSPATELDAASQARAMSGVLQRLGTTAATAVGHSFGADVVLAMAR